MTRDIASSVSVALCTRNGAMFLEAQLRSILEQSAIPEEVVVSDDDSSDSTIAIVASFADEFEAAGIRLTVLRNSPPLGVTANFERALRATNGSIIALSDQDDVWHPDRLSQSIGELTRRPSLDLIFSDARLIDAAGAEIGDGLFEALEFGRARRNGFHSDGAFATLLRRNVVTGATVVLRRRLLDSALPFPDAWLHDEWLAIIAASTGELDFIDSPLIDYRQHGSNEIGVHRPTLRYKISRVIGRRGDRNERLARRGFQLAERLDELADQTSHLLRVAAHRKAAMESAREALPAKRLRRLKIVYRLYKSGAYQALSSQGRLDAVRDALQSHRR